MFQRRCLVHKPHVCKRIFQGQEVFGDLLRFLVTCCGGGVGQDVAILWLTFGFQEIDPLWQADSEFHRIRKALLGGVADPGPVGQVLARLDPVLLLGEAGLEPQVRVAAITRRACRKDLSTCGIRGRKRVFVME